MDQEQTLIQTLAIVFQCLESFISQKINQNLMHAIFNIKKEARIKPIKQLGSVNKKSILSLSQKSSSLRKNQISLNNQVHSHVKQSHTSFNKIKDAQSIIGKQRKGIQLKNNTHKLHNANKYLSNNELQQSQLSSPFTHNKHPSKIIPKSAGSVYSQQILDMQQSFNKDKKNQINFRNHQQSIAQVQNDDDQFEDIILNRLDDIQEKVSQILRQKKSSKLIMPKSRVSVSDRRHIPHTKIHNVASVGNMAYPNYSRNTEFYSLNEPEYIRSTAIMSSRHHTYQNGKNNSIQPSLQKSNIKPYSTQRHNNNLNIPKRMQNYKSNSQQYVTGRRNATSNYQRQEYVPYSQNEAYQATQKQTIKQQKVLGRYRQSQDSLIESDILDRINLLENKQRNLSENTVDYQKIRRGVVNGLSDIRYIPMLRVETLRKGRGQPNVQSKTQRQVLREHDQEKPIKTGQETTRYQPLDKQSGNNQRKGQGSTQFKNQNKNQVHEKKEQHRLQTSDLRTYTQHAYHPQENNQHLSVSSEKNLYSQIRELGEMMKVQRASKKMLRDFNQSRGDTFDHGRSRDTQRLVGEVERGHRQSQGYQVDTYGQYAQRRVRMGDNHSKNHTSRPEVIPSNRVQEMQFFDYPYQKEQITNGQNQSSRLVHFVRQRQQPGRYYEKRTTRPHQQRGTEVNDIYVNSLSGQSKIESQSKLSLGSIASFRSIPYCKAEAMSKPSSRRLIEQQKQKSVEYVIEKSNNYLRNMPSRNWSQY